jgi:basic membrane protein A
VAVLLPGASNDGSWNSLGFEAVVQMRRELGLTVDFAENVTPEKGLTVMRDYASKGYGLIIMHGGWQYTDAMKKAGQEFPNTWFLLSSDALSGPNLAGVSIKYEEITYLAGMAAAKASKGDKFGFINGPKIGGNIAMTEGFRQGVQTVKPNAEVFETYLDSWTDAPGATAAANTMFDKGADLILYSLNLADQPVLKIAQERGKKAINVSYDLNNLAPDTLLTSVVISVPASFVVPATLWKDKKLEGKTYSLGLKEQALALAPFRGKLSKEDEAAIDKAKKDIVAGTIQIKIPS